jgi:hypothetical protein
MATFHQLYTGAVPKLRLCICIGATNAKREDINVAVWELDQDWLLKIVVSIADHENRYNRSRGYTEITPEQAAIQCDETGIENRFFRLDAVVAEWLDTTQPVQTDIDFVVL